MVQNLIEEKLDRMKVAAPTSALSDAYESYEGRMADFIMRGDQLSRQWRILRQLEVNRHGLTATEIAEMGGISLRTAYRDLDDLQLAGFPLYSEKRAGCRCWKFVDTYKSNLPFPFTYTELMSLHMSRDLFKIFKGTVFFESLESLYRRKNMA